MSGKRKRENVRKWTPSAGTNPLVQLRLTPEIIERIDAVAAKMNESGLPGMPLIDRAAVIRVAILDLLARRTDGAIKPKMPVQQTRTQAIMKPKQGFVVVQAARGGGKTTQAVEVLLRSSPTLSDVEIARATGVSRATVQRMRRKLGIAPLTFGGKVRS